MKRHFRVTKTKSFRFDPKKMESFKKVALVCITIIAAILLLAKIFFLLLENLSYFNITRVDTVSNVPIDIKDLEKQVINRNIFKVDLLRLRQDIQKRFPQLKLVRITRIIPNRILIEAKMRTAIFQLKFGWFYTISQEGVVLMKIGNTKTKGLIEVTGLNPDPKSFKVGGLVTSKKFDLAVSVLRYFKRIGFSKKYVVSVVDITDPKNMVLILYDNIEVRMGSEDFDKRLKMLYDLLSEPKIDFKKIRYIDLRFKDVIIGPR